MGKEDLLQSTNHSESDDCCSHNDVTESRDREARSATCRVCQCTESDKRGDVVLGFLGISLPESKTNKNVKVDSPLNDKISPSNSKQSNGKGSSLVEFIGPDGEVFVCNADIETGSRFDQDELIELGCSCKNDLAIVHYACGLKWFISHGSTVCEICGCIAKNIRTADFKKVVASLKEYEALRERTASGEPNPARLRDTDTSIDPDAVAAIRRQRLSEITSWFSPHNHNHHNYTAFSQVLSELPPSSATVEDVPAENAVTKWAVECTGILLATGLLTVTLAWIIAPHVGKKTASSGLHILLGGICALTVVVFFRFFVLTRIKYGPARYWAILFVFWFLVFGIWASRTHRSHTT